MLEMVFADQGDTSEQAQDAAHNSKTALIVLKRPEASREVVLLQKRWVVERLLAWLSRSRRLGRNLERLSSTLIDFHFVAAGVLLLTKLRPVLGEAVHLPLERYFQRGCLWGADGYCEAFPGREHLALTLLPEDMLNVCVKALTEKNQQVLGGVVDAVTAKMVHHLARQ